MKVIGCRFSNTYYAFCVMSGAQDNPIIEDSRRVNFPADYRDPELFNWLHHEISTLFAAHRFDALAIKKAESTVKRSNSLESRVAAGAIAMLVAGQAGCLAHQKMKATIAKDLGMKGKGGYLKTKLDTSVIKGFESYSEPLQESILVAWSCL